MQFPNTGIMVDSSLKCQISSYVLVVGKLNCPFNFMYKDRAKCLVVHELYFNMYLVVGWSSGDGRIDKKYLAGQTLLYYV